MPNKASIYLESTTVSVARTITQIIEDLMRSKQVAEVSQVREPRAIRFMVEIETKVQWFQIKANPSGVTQQWKASHAYNRNPKDGQIEMIAWRQQYEYVRSILMMVESGQVSVLGGFLPMAVAWDGVLERELSAAEAFESRLLLAAGPATTEGEQ